MRKAKPERAYQLPLLQAGEQIQVAMKVSAKHPLLVLKGTLDWPAIREVFIENLRKAGCNVDHGPGRPFDIDLYVPLITLMIIKGMASRQMEEYLAENAVARIFIDWEQHAAMQVRDHSNIARAIESLGEEGVKELNALTVRHAIELGLADPAILSADTTAQELPIGYPNEPGILRGLAERSVRALVKLRNKGKRGTKAIEEKFKEIIKKAKEHHLFAKTKEKKEEILRSMMCQTKSVLGEVEALTERLSSASDRTVVSSMAQLKKMVEVGTQLLPQIEYWLRTGYVASGKILHAGITASRSIVRNKAGKKVEFGFQYLICAVGGGYIFGELIDKPTGETKMPSLAMTSYRDTLDVDESQAPEMFVFDRGGWSKANVQKLKDEGVKKIGIQPKGQAEWQVQGTDRKQVLSERGMMEGRIGTLKTEKYKFNKPKQRKSGTVRAAGQRSILSYNLNKLMREVPKANTAMLATA